MGWMSWEHFGCKVNHVLLEEMTDKLVDDGYLAAGYTTISIDDCWMNRTRDMNGHIHANERSFPSGMKAMGEYMHSRSVRFGSYSDVGKSSCKNFPGMLGHEEDDATTFASWGVDYLKVDGCHEDKSNFSVGYPLVGAALQGTGRNITYSCSWPAYIGLNESLKPFDAMIAAGCNLWRNTQDIHCHWSSLARVISHWGDYGEVLQKFAGPGHWHDPDQLLIGNGCISTEEEKTQMAIWSISASPLIMGNDLRNVSEESKAILLNMEAIRVNQDPLGKMGVRHPAYTSNSSTQTWFRELAGGDVAVALHFAFADACKWNVTEGGYIESCTGNVDFRFKDLALPSVQDICCQNPECAGIDFQATGWLMPRSGFFKADQDCNKTVAPQHTGYTKISSHAVSSTDIVLDLTEVGFSSEEEVSVYDIWLQKHVGGFKGSYTAKNVALHGTAFLRLSKQVLV
jgi:alpha-N-acetylgalactosaminidase